MGGAAAGAAASSTAVHPHVSTAGQAGMRIAT
jgi:hypothetical protein